MKDVASVGATSYFAPSPLCCKEFAMHAYSPALSPREQLHMRMSLPSSIAVGLTYISLCPNARHSNAIVYVIYSTVVQYNVCSIIWYSREIHN